MYRPPCEGKWNCKEPRLEGRKVCALHKPRCTCGDDYETHAPNGGECHGVDGGNRPEFECGCPKYRSSDPTQEEIVEQLREQVRAAHTKLIQLQQKLSLAEAKLAEKK